MKKFRSIVFLVTTILIVVSAQSQSEYDKLKKTIGSHNYSLVKKMIAGGG